MAARVWRVSRKPVGDLMKLPLYPVLRRGHRMCLLLLLAVAWASPVRGATPVLAISFAQNGDGGMVVRFHTAEPVQAFREPVVSGHHVEVLLFNAELAPSYRAARPPAPVRNVHVESARGHLKFTFVLDPQLHVRARAFRDRDSSELLLGLEFAADVARPLPLARLPEPESPIRSSATQGEEDLDRATTAARWRLDTIVIDAGHGGHDHGAVAYGIREKDLALQVARKLGRLIERELDTRVVYTRDEDRFIPLRERGRIANESGGKLFISIHANAAHNGAANGTETFFLGMHKSDAARDVMERENSVVQFEEDQTHYENMTDEALILQTLAHSAFMRKSEELASLVETEIGGHSIGRSRGVKQAGFYVLWSASMPAILVEMGFVTNRREAEFLAGTEGQEYIARGILRAVREFKDRYERDLQLVSP